MDFIKKYRAAAAIAFIAAAVSLLLFISGHREERRSALIDASPLPNHVSGFAVTDAPEPAEAAGEVLPLSTEEPPVMSSAQPDKETRVGGDAVSDSGAGQPFLETAEAVRNESAEMSGEDGSDAAMSEGGGQTLPEPLPESDSSETVTVREDREMTCVLSVRCDTLLDKLSRMKPEKRELVPPDGVIFKESRVVFYEGESVFNVLLREMKKNKIHMEFENTPVYHSAYIKGINNIYEFDCGELSGWMYRVNGLFPDYGCSRCALKEGDIVEFLYTCDLGADVGNYYSPQNRSEQ